MVVVGGWFYPLLGFFIPFCMLVGMGIGLFRGRQWCNWLCPRGAFLDATTERISPRRVIPRFVKGFPLRAAVVAFLAAMMMVQIIRRWPDPSAIGMFFVVMLTLTTLLALVLAVTVHPRTWCSVCPIGSLANLVGRRRYPLCIDSDLCTDCGLCGKVCPIQVKPYESKSTAVQAVKDGDCLKCGLCVAGCPVEALSLGEGEDGETGIDHGGERAGNPVQRAAAGQPRNG